MRRALFAQAWKRKHGSELPTRREMLRASLAAGAGLLLSNLVGCGRAAGGRQVVVIGAGFAGLACAYELKSIGYNVTVCEARSRLGGRVLSSNNLAPGRNIELGGELIGTNHKHWISYADRFGLKLIEMTEDEEAEAPIVFDGTKLPKEESDKVWEEIEEGCKRLNDDARNVNAEQPWATENAKALDSRSMAQWLAEQDFSEPVKKGVAATFTADNGVDLDKQSYLGMLTQIKGGGVETFWTETETHRCEGGNQQLAVKLAEAIGTSRVRTNAAVVKIEVGDKAVTVTLKDGSSLTADDVVLAVPPSTWDRIVFVPPLPAALKPQMGVNVKFFPVVKNRFWEEQKLSQYSLSNGPVSMTWDGTDNQPGEGPACLTCFSGGTPAATCRSWKSEEREAKYLEELERRYPGIREHFVKSAFFDWPGDALTGAGYSFPAPGEVTTVSPLLYQGLNRLHFAGEHACYAFVGYMEGALCSGVSLARRIAKRDKVIQ